MWVFFELIAVGGISFAVAYGLQTLKRSKSAVVTPSSQSILRLILGRKVARVRFDRSTGKEWIVDHPIAKDEPPSITKGMPVYGSFGSSSGVVKFRSVVSDILGNGKLALQTPRHTLIQERRQERRVAKNGPVIIEGVSSNLIDISSLGGKFSTTYQAERGERIRLDFFELGEPLFGWVLENSRSYIRVRFEEKIDLVTFA